MSNTFFVVCIFTLPLAVLAISLVKRGAARNRLMRLTLQERAEEARRAPDFVEWEKYGTVLRFLNDRLGKAGYYSEGERRRLRLTCLLLGSGLTASFSSLGVHSGPVFVALSGLGGVYLSIMLYLYHLRFGAREVEREIVFQLPLVLESLILLVESGLGVLPALQTTVQMREQTDRKDPLTRILRLVYEMSAHGLPFGLALELVAGAVGCAPLRHVLLHLDITSSEGGELIPSLRSLSDYTHTDWRLSVETRVKRLENLVVFPVFVSVIGLMILAASVPMVPVLKFFDSLDQRKTELTRVDKRLSQQQALK